MRKNKFDVVICVILVLVLVTSSSCISEVKEKLSKAKKSVSNTTTIIEKAKEAQEDIENLKDVRPLTNDELKEWLPESVKGLNRTGFKVGVAGYANVASIEGTYKFDEEKQKFTVNIIDGAGPAGSMVIVGLGMAAKMNMEQEDESKHIKTVTVNGIRAQQTFYKKRNETSLQFVVDNRFGIMVNAVNIDPDATWQMVEKLNLKELANLAQ